MTTIDFSYPTSVNKLSLRKAKNSYKISIREGPILEVSLGRPQRGGQCLGKKHRVRGFYVDPDGQVFAEFNAIDRSGYFYQYVIIGKLQNLQEGSV